jgi:hypothetical protein
VASLEGGWSGQATLTPVGPMPFALVFDRLADGSLHARTASDSATWIDLRFTKSESGAWTLVESAAMAGIGEQTHPLQLVADSPAGTVRFATALEGGDLTMDFTVADGALRVLVRIRGTDHAAFLLHRVPDEAVPAIRSALESMARRAPSAPAAGYAGPSR